MGNIRLLTKTQGKTFALCPKKINYNWFHSLGLTAVMYHQPRRESSSIWSAHWTFKGLKVIWKKERLPLSAPSALEAPASEITSVRIK